MKPESLTASQIIGALTPTQVKAIATSILAGISIVAGGGFWVGKTLADNNALNQALELKSTISQLQTKTDNAMSKLEFANSSYTQLTAAYAQTKRLLAQRNQETSQLSKELGREDNCLYVHGQIEETKKEIQTIPHFGLLAENFDANGKAKRQEENTDRISLENRLMELHKQLGTCNK